MYRTGSFFSWEIRCLKLLGLDNAFEFCSSVFFISLTNGKTTGLLPIGSGLPLNNSGIMSDMMEQKIWNTSNDHFGNKDVISITIFYTVA